jgi:hypothetical protein
MNKHRRQAGDPDVSAHAGQVAYRQHDAIEVVRTIPDLRTAPVLVFAWAPESAIQSHEKQSASLSPENYYTCLCQQPAS